MDVSHSVVKFMVKVRFVEKRAKRRVGRVMVVKVMIQINNPGNPLAIANKACPSNASHEVDSVVPAGTVNSEAWAVAIAAVVAVLRREVELGGALRRLSRRGESIACDAAPAAESHVGEPPLPDCGPAVQAPRAGWSEMACIVGVGGADGWSHLSY